MEIGWRTTKIKTPDNNYAIIPNSQFTANQLINFSSPTTTQAISVDFPINPNADLTAVGNVLEHSARQVPSVLTDPSPSALAVAVKPDHILFRLKFWIDDHKKGEAATSAIVERAYQSLRDMEATPGSSATTQRLVIESRAEEEKMLRAKPGKSDHDEKHEQKQEHSNERKQGQKQEPEQRKRED